jgi:hypothetical protein
MKVQLIDTLTLTEVVLEVIKETGRGLWNNNKF